MIVLGLSGGFHDAAAALVVDGAVAAAVEQERLSRRKHDPSFPADAAATCLAIAGVAAADVDVVACHEKPLDVTARHLSTRVRSGPRSVWPLLHSTPHVLRTQLALPRRIAALFRDLGAATPPVCYVPHHLSHAAAAFYPSPFDHAAVLTVDGVGEWSTASVGHGHAHRLTVDQELDFPNSVGLLYSAFTGYCGLRVNGGEGELMGLAPFGVPRFADQIRAELVRQAPDGSIELEGRAFAYLHGRRLTSRRFHRAFGGPPRPLGAEPTQREADLAASVQVVTEEVVTAMARHALERSGADALALAGGVALNCVANGRLRRELGVDVWVQPAPGDAGSALGAALWAWHEHLGNPRPAPTGDAMAGAFLGPSFDRDEVSAWAAASGRPHRLVADDAELVALVAERIDAGAVVGWFTGAMEFGPRALGHRSILADPRRADLRDRLNAMVKERAPYRPFAPAVLAEESGAWFDLAGEAPFMTFAAPVAAAHRRAVPGSDAAQSIAEQLAEPRSDIPAVTHVDGSARVQTVDAGRNPRFAALLRAFHERTGCPVLLNTSFNARDEPIVCTPADALATFERIGLDLLVVEHCTFEAAP